MINDLWGNSQRSLFSCCKQCKGGIKMTVHNPNGKIFGYIRVSTREQNEDRQIFALTEYGVKPSNIYQRDECLQKWLTFFQSLFDNSVK